MYGDSSSNSLMPLTATLGSYKLLKASLITRSIVTNIKFKFVGWRFFLMHDAVT